MNIIENIDWLILETELNKSDLSNIEISKELDVDEQKYKDVIKRQKDISVELKKSGIPINDIKIKIIKKAKLDSKTLKFDLSETVKNILDELKTTGIIKSLGVGLLILLLVLISSIYAGEVVKNLFPENNTLQMFIIVVILAPIIEEFGKYASVKYKATAGHLFAFNIFEFASYFLNMGGGISAVISRSSAIFMHMVNTLIHKHHKEKSEKEKKDFTKLGLLLAIIVHMIWNTFGFSLMLLSKMI